MASGSGILLGHKKDPYFGPVLNGLHMRASGTFAMSGVWNQIGELHMNASGSFAANGLRAVPNGSLALSASGTFAMDGIRAVPNGSLALNASGAFVMSGLLNQSGSLSMNASGTQAMSGELNNTGSLVLNATGTFSITNNAPDAMVDVDWDVTTGTSAGELDFVVNTAPDSEGPIIRYEYTTNSGTDWATLTTGTSATVSTLSQGGSISDAQAFTTSVGVRAVSAFGNGGNSNFDTVTAGTAGGAYDPADVAEGYFEIGRAGQEHWQETSGQTTTAGSGDPVGEIENIGTGSVNFFALNSTSRGTLNTTDDVVEITQGTDAVRLQPGSVPSDMTLAIYGDIASTTPNDSFRIFSVKGSSQAHDYNAPGAFTVEWNYTDNESYLNYSNGGVVDTWDFTSGWNTEPIIMTWEFADGGDFEIYQNNVLVGSGTHSGAMPGTETDLDIGIAYTSGGAVGMDVKAFAYFDEILSASDRGDLNTYLAAL